MSNRWVNKRSGNNKMSNKLPKSLPILGVLVLAVLLFGSRFFKSVPPGHVGVATIFGKVVDTPYQEGLHIPVNPLYSWKDYDVRMKTHFEEANVPSQDQLQTSLEVSVQYRLLGSEVPNIYRDTGTVERMIEVHLRPKLRSLLREQGKSIKRAEDFFLEETQEQLQASLTTGLQDYLAPKGIEIEAALIRDIQLPPFLLRLLKQKKNANKQLSEKKLS